MSKPMNKYHKCISELGRSMPGWVKVGALALSIGGGMGAVHVPGGGKVWAGNWQITMRKACDANKPSSIEVCNVESGEVDTYKVNMQEKFKVCSSNWFSSDIFNEVRYSSESISFKIDDFRFLLRINGRLEVAGGTPKDGLRIDGFKSVLVQYGTSLRARVFNVCNCDEFVNDGEVVSADILAANHCGKFFSGRLKTKLLSFSYTVASLHDVESTAIVQYEDTATLELASKCSSIKRSGQFKKFSLSGIDHHSLQGVFEGNDWVSHNRGKFGMSIPFAEVKGLEKEVFDEVQFCKFPEQGEYYCVAFFYLGDSYCGNGKNIIFLAENKQGETLSKAVVYLPGGRNVISPSCILNLGKQEDLYVKFQLGSTIKDSCVFYNTPVVYCFLIK